jgi:hypothetical protein
MFREMFRASWEDEAVILEEETNKPVGRKQERGRMPGKLGRLPGGVRWIAGCFCEAAGLLGEAAGLFGEGPRK